MDGPSFPTLGHSIRESIRHPEWQAAVIFSLKGSDREEKFQPLVCPRLTRHNFSFEGLAVHHIVVNVIPEKLCLVPWICCQAHHNVRCNLLQY